MEITRDRLTAIGFKQTKSDECPYEWWERDEIMIWDFNDRYWIVNALDQGGIDVEFRTMEDLSKFWVACQKPALCFV